MRLAAGSVGKHPSAKGERLSACVGALLVGAVGVLAAFAAPSAPAQPPTVAPSAAAPGLTPTTLAAVRPTPAPITGTPSEPTADELIRVAIKPIEPFVAYGDSGPRGYSIDLWNAIAARLGVQTEWVQRDTVNEVLTDVTDRRADAAIAAISMTPAREEVIDFSHAYFDSGLQVLVRTQRTSGILDALGSVFGGGLARPLVFFALAILAIAHLLWFAERRDNPDFPRSYRRGIVESVWYSLVNVTTGGDAEKTLNRPLGRVFAAGWMVMGLFLVAYVTATVTTNLTVGRLRNDIAGLADVGSRTIATVDGTVSADYLEARGYRTLKTKNVEAAFEALLAGEADAVVHDAPALRFFAANRGAGRVETAGPVFRPDKYAIAVSSGSELRERVNATLLELRDDGTIERLDAEYFSRTR